MMKRNATRILAINPGSRYWGIAVFDEAELVDWRVRVFRSSDHQSKLQQAAEFLDDLLSRHHPQLLVLKRLHPRRSSAALDQLVAGLCDLAKRRGLRLCRLSIGEMAQVMPPAKQVNKQALFDQVVAAYPSLARELHAERGAKNPYHCRMLEAVMLGMAFRRSFSGN